MRVLLCTWGSLGDLYPYLTIAARLAADGHYPVLAAPPFYQRAVEDAGIAFHGVPTPCKAPRRPAPPAIWSENRPTAPSR